MGNPHETNWFYEGFRDYGQNEPTTQKVIYDPAQAPDARKGFVSEEEGARIDEMIHRFNEKVKCAPFYVQKPAFQDPPFFSDKFMPVAEITVPNGGFGAAVAGLSIEVADRQWAQFSCIGADVCTPIIISTRQLVFWIEVAGEVLPLWDDQSPVAPATLTEGQTTIIQGSTVEPFDMRGCGVDFGVRGPSIVTFNVANFSAAPEDVRIMLGYFQYWMPKADQFQEGQCVR